MVRARLASLALAGSLLFVAGCEMCQRDPCDTGGGCFASHGGWFSKFRLASRNNAPECCGEGAVISGGTVHHGMIQGEGPALISPDAFITNPSSVPNGKPPRIVPIPQANPMPYTP